MLERLVTFSLTCGLQASQSIQCPPICNCVVVVVVGVVVVVVVVVVVAVVVVAVVLVIFVVVVDFFVVVVVCYYFTQGSSVADPGCLSGSRIRIFQSRIFRS